MLQVGILSSLDSYFRLPLIGLPLFLNVLTDILCGESGSPKQHLQVVPDPHTILASGQ